MKVMKSETSECIIYVNKKYDYQFLRAYWITIDWLVRVSGHVNYLGN